MDNSNNLAPDLNNPSLLPAPYSNILTHVTGSTVIGVRRYGYWGPGSGKNNMNHTLKTLPQSTAELIITVPPAEYEKHLEKAAQRLSEKTQIKGFRPGKAPYDIAKREFGEMKILQEAAEDIAQETFFEALQKEKLETIGAPKIEIEKLAPGNEIVFKAMAAILPKIKLANIKRIKVEKTVKTVGEKHVDEVLENLRRMQAKEVIKNDKKAGAQDKLVIDMDMFLAKVSVEGGQTKNYQVYLSEPHYIPGFNEQMLGLGKNEEKEFFLDFPATHYQKHLAGKKVQFKVKVKDIYERQLPELSDELAKSLGQESLSKLRELINSNLQKEAEQKAEQQFEIALLEKMIEQSEFEPIPEILIDAERQKMFHELKHDLERNGITIEKYLEDIKKKEADLFNDFKAQAEKRAKAALISRQIALEQKISVSDEELNKEIKFLEDIYKDNDDYLKNLKRPDVRNTIAVTLQNKKVMQWLKERVGRN